MKKRLLLLLLCLTLLLTGCAAGKEQMPVFRIYGLSDTPGSDAISAVTVDWSGQKSLTVDRQAQAALEQLLGGCTEPGYRSPIPQGVQLRSCQLTGGMALVDFSQGYEQLSGIDLTMADYCVTLTLSQLPGVSVVRITVEGQELHLAIVNGLSHAKELIADVEAGKRFYHLVVVMTCQGGCVGGAGQPYGLTAAKKRRGAGLYEADATAMFKGAEKNPIVTRLLDEYGHERCHELLHVRYGE